MQSIQTLPNNLKPRELLARQGASSLTLTDLLAVILGTGSARHDVLVVANEAAQLLHRQAVGLAELQAIKGMGTNKALRVLAALQLGPSLAQGRQLIQLKDAESIWRAMNDLVEAPQENLVCFYLSVRQHRLCRSTVSIGTMAASLIHPREVFRPAIQNNAAAIVLAHNHPSGVVEPSSADLRATRIIAEAGQIIGIELLDHVVCGVDTYHSIRAQAPELFVGNQTPFC